MEIVNGNLSWFLLNLNSKFSHFLLILRRRGICSAACDYLNLFTAHITCDGSRHKSGACQLNIYPSSTWFSEWTLATNTGVTAEMNDLKIILWNVQQHSLNKNVWIPQIIFYDYLWTGVKLQKCVTAIFKECKLLILLLNLSDDINYWLRSRLPCCF